MSNVKLLLVRRVALFFAHLIFFLLHQSGQNKVFSPIFLVGIVLFFYCFCRLLTKCFFWEWFFMQPISWLKSWTYFKLINIFSFHHPVFVRFLPAFCKAFSMYYQKRLLLYKCICLMISLLLNVLYFQSYKLLNLCHYLIPFRFLSRLFY